MAKGVGGGVLAKTKTKAAAATPKKRSTTAAAKPVKKLSKEEKRKAEHMARIARLIEEQKSGKKLSKAGEWLIAHPFGFGGTYDMRAVMK